MNNPTHHTPIGDGDYIDEHVRSEARSYFAARYDGQRDWPRFWRRREAPYPEFVDLCARKAATRVHCPQDDGREVIVDGWGQIIYEG